MFPLSNPIICYLRIRFTCMYLASTRKSVSCTKSNISASLLFSLVVCKQWYGIPCLWRNRMTWVSDPLSWLLQRRWCNSFSNISEYKNLRKMGKELHYVHLIMQVISTGSLPSCHPCNKSTRQWSCTNIKTVSVSESLQALDQRVRTIQCKVEQPKIKATPALKQELRSCIWDQEQAHEQRTSSHWTSLTASGSPLPFLSVAI